MTSVQLESSSKLEASKSKSEDKAVAKPAVKLTSKQLKSSSKLAKVSSNSGTQKKGKAVAKTALKATPVRSEQSKPALVIEGENSLEKIRKYDDVNNLTSLSADILEEDTDIDDTYQELPADFLSDFFSGASRAGDISIGVSLASSKYAQNFIESSLLGHVHDESREEVHINTHEPFCLVAVGVQGSGKSHTLGSILESCMVPFSSIVRLKEPMTTLVLHYDNNAESSCEATGLIQGSSYLQAKMKAFTEENKDMKIAPLPRLPKDKMIILVSPSYYEQRKKFYDSYCIVKPLLFQWRTLSADQIKRLMRINDGDNQLYVAGMLDLLRRYQRQAKVPEFELFVEQLKEVCNVQGQSAPLLQRLNLLSAIVAESAVNTTILTDSLDLNSACAPGTLVIVDLTDPLLSRDEANGIFQVLTEQFRALPSSQSSGKLLALDEAHKFMKGDASDGLSEAIVNAARLMRHDGMRLVVSTQNPSALAPELLELVTVAVMHRFHSRDWFTHLSSKIALPESSWDSIKNLETGVGMVFCATSRLDGRPSCGVIPVRIRERLTADRGSSKTNTAAIAAVPASASR